ncbi:hypothetical protein ANCCAN_04736 [Ancylostoma caninum]|uniref:ZP domain-containing protein n=1 Tax=Ancylostoma caninum TaxID=29170 RepID=A0A368GXT1_ANCCA|nr:hypothetical protein ANCCAN_04736 [Ancylostoma caninum]
MERQRLKERKRCSRSFHMIPWNHMVIRGEAKLWNVPGGFAKCLGLCNDCDYVVYNEYYGECFLVYYDQFGQQFNFINDGYQVFENLCHQPLLNCSSKNAMYISHHHENTTLREDCLQRCIADQQCKYAYLSNTTCMISAKEKPLKKLIEKHCVGFDDANIKIRREPFVEGGIDLNVETICNYDSVVVKIGLLFENVIVVKQNTLRDLPVITEYDQLYRISCDYTNHTTKMSATSILQLREGDYSRLSPMGKVPYPPMKMELRSKPDKEVKTVILGQDVDLTIEDEDNIIGNNFTISNCVANGMGSHDNITLIEDGCPTRSAREYIVRGGIKKETSGFSIPLRAFRFRNGDGVTIKCRLDTCKQECVQPSCSTKSRRRRYLTEDPIDLGKSEEVEITLIVNEEARVEDLEQL